MARPGTSRARGVFVTGTDTDCGKTQVACALARELRGEDLRVRVLKPIETGCELRRGERVAADALALAEAAGDDDPPERICPYRLALPAAPVAAARFAGVELEYPPIAEALAKAQRDADWLIVEGAGGLRVPALPGLDMAGLAGRLGLPLVVVARAALGTINHTRLTLDAALAAGLRVAGVIVSHTEPALSDADTRNLALLLEDLPVPCLGVLRHGAERIEPPGCAKRLAAGPC